MAITDPIPATYLSPSSLAVSTDLTGQFSTGVRVQADCGVDGLQYGTVASSSYADPTTTVTLEMDDGDALTSNLVSIMHGNDDKKSLVNHADQHGLEARDSIASVIASMPAHFSRSAPLAAKTVATAADRYTLHPWGRFGVNISENGFFASVLADMVLSDPTMWDSTATDYTVAANRVGRDFYLYACMAGGVVPTLLLSANATYPAGYTAATSRKLGGFHCLCADVGTIAGHTLSGYVAGDILPASVWDLRHRPVSSPEGMVYVSGIGRWVDIYLSSVSGGVLVSAYGGTCADGTSSPAFHWYKFSQWFGQIGKRMPTQTEFVAASLGSNQGTNISGGADPVITGGHTDTAGRRMISNVGCEDTCGAMWQWGAEAGGGAAAASWADAYDANDANVAGRSFQASNRALFGGAWPDGPVCGSRSSIWQYGPLYISAYRAARGVSDTLAVGA